MSWTRKIMSLEMLLLHITEAVLLHCNIVNNDYQHNSTVLYTFVLNKSFGQLLDTSPKNFYIFIFKNL